MTLNKEWISMAEIIQEGASTVRAFFESKHLYLEIRCSSELPDVFCDSTRIRQVIINLLSNAGRFTEQGGVLIKAWCEQEKVWSALRIPVPALHRRIRRTSLTRSSSWRVLSDGSTRAVDWD
jgi:two-component system sensor histidine kinase EvgS